MADDDMKKIFINQKTNDTYKEGDLIKRELLAKLLIKLSSASDPVKLFYKDGVAETIVGEMRDYGGFITIEDLETYESEVYDKPVISEVLPDNLVMCGPPPPSSFAIMQIIVGVMAQFYNHSKIDLNDPLIYHRFIEAEKFAFAQHSKLSDVKFNKEAFSLARNMTKPAFIKWISKIIKNTSQSSEYYSKNFTTHVPDHGTSHVVVIDDEGNGVSVTSTVNQLLGALRVSPTLGIIWNNEMNDFSLPNVLNAFGFAPSPKNFIEPKKRPMSSMSPTIIYNSISHKIKMIIGASGGSKIISSIAQTIVRTLLFNQTVKEAIDAPRLHNQFLPNDTEYEITMPKEIVDTLIHDYKQSMISTNKQLSVVQALIVHNNGYIYGNSDFRRKTATYPTGF